MTKTVTQKFMGANQLIDRLGAQMGSRDAAVNMLQARGHLYPGTENLTPAGRARDNMTAEERAIDRASKRTKAAPKSLVYNPKTNRATLRKSK